MAAEEEDDQITLGKETWKICGQQDTSAALQHRIEMVGGDRGLWPMFYQERQSLRHVSKDTNITSTKQANIYR